jgi:hypothetical protein
MKPLPRGFDRLEPEEAIRRIKERDHTDARNGATMPFVYEQALIYMLGTGQAVAGLNDQGVLGFTVEELDEEEAR